MTPRHPHFLPYFLFFLGPRRGNGTEGAGEGGGDQGALVGEQHPRGSEARQDAALGRLEGGCHLAGPPSVGLSNKVGGGCRAGCWPRLRGLPGCQLSLSHPKISAA